MKSGKLVQGKKVAEFEKQFAKYCGSKYAIAVSSGTSALHCSLYAIGIKQGDEIITSPFTFVATANAILLANGTPKFVDIDKGTLCLDSQKLEKAINKKTKAIIAVSLYGMPYDQNINQIAKKHGIKVIEDAAQAFGSKVENKKCGNLADLTAFSFYPTKNITSGEGGMITTNNKNHAELCRRFRDHGQSQIRYAYHDIGNNYRMTEIAAVIGLNQLKKAEKMINQRIKNAKTFNQKLKNIKDIALPKIPTNIRHSFNQFTIRTKKRAQVQKHLLKRAIQTGVYYPKSLHLYPHFQKFGYRKGDFPIAEEASKEVLSIPVHPELKKSEIEKIVKEIQTICKN